MLATLWARTRIDDLMSQDFNGAQRGAMKAGFETDASRKLGLEYRLMTQFTSFVAVEEMIVTDGGKPRRIDVPVEVPEGVNRSAIFGEREETKAYGLLQSTNTLYRNPSAPPPRVRPVGDPKPSVAGNGAGAGISSGRQSNNIIVDDVSAVKTMSPDEQKRVALQSKLHPAVLAVVDRLKARNAVAGADEGTFIHNGKADLQIWFVDKSDEAMARLKELGFEIVLDPKTAKMVIGRLPIEKLAALADMKSIRYVAPQAK